MIFINGPAADLNPDFVRGLLEAIKTSGRRRDTELQCPQSEELRNHLGFANVMEAFYFSFARPRKMLEILYSGRHKFGVCTCRGEIYRT